MAPHEDFYDVRIRLRVGGDIFLSIPASDLSSLHTSLRMDDGWFEFKSTPPPYNTGFYPMIPAGMVHIKHRSDIVAWTCNLIKRTYPVNLGPG